MEHSPAEPNSLDSLQFRRAEVAEEASATGDQPCSACSSGITSEYYHLNGVSICPGCAGQWRQLSAAPGKSTLLRGLLYGGGAALAATTGLGIFNWFTNWRLALLAIAVGWLVGVAFRKGTGGMGSRACQWLAVGLTYFAITMSEVPTGLRAIAEQQAKTGEAAEVAAGDTAAAPVAEASGREDSPVVTLTDDGEQAEPVGLAAAVGILTALFLAAPFLELADGIGGLINLAIIFFGLQQAWRITAADRRELVGPLYLDPQPLESNQPA